ncbi:MAG: valine--tRNA ligase [Candidatus Eiseniibacteriota bacterium]|nr:MAG: valine--tRNA ligase [Candidatus Eisenbacteria bacterium]
MREENSEEGRPAAGPYDPSQVEEKWYSYWLEKGCFSASPREDARPYCIVIPPPNVTGILTMGHVLNNTLQDIIIRWRRMEGYETLWLPGTDHAGIATQNVVERALLKKKVRKEELGREKFLKEVWKWREEYGGTIIKQLQVLGCSCDWSRERFTMDEGLSKAVEEVFIRLYNKGLIYRGNYIINWCPRCRTALSDEEAEHVDTQGSLYYIKYPIQGTQKHVTVATTRPETMLGDVAVAVSPKDPRFKHAIGRMAVLPFLRREMPIIADDYVDPKFGTGAVKVTPAHDPNDFEVGKRHKLEPVVVMNEDGTMNENAGDFAGMDRFDCRKKLLEALEDRGLLAKTEPYEYAIGHCYRCHTIVEPFLSEQWFVKMKPLAAPAIEAARKGEVKFFPKRWNKVYLHWLEGIRDWCISRQLWWGHRIPIWYCNECGEIHASASRPERCKKCPSRSLRQDSDVLDTWFSSWLWPFSTLGWPEETEDLKYFYPTSLLVSAHDIIFFWIARMVMAGFEFTGRAPFAHVHIHGIVRDEIGRRMSKSLGNSPDPLDIMEEYGTDALRFTMTLLTPTGQDILFSSKKLDTGKHFANKLWNASRLAIANLEGFDPSRVSQKSLTLSLEDRWILSRLSRLTKETGRNLTTYRFNLAARCLYEFAWGELCDWYLELAKIRFYGDKESPGYQSAQFVTHRVLDSLLRLLHPFMPFITEEIWQRLPGSGESIVRARWPRSSKALVDEEAEEQMLVLQRAVSAIRNIRSEMNVAPSRKASVLIKADSRTLGILKENEGSLKFLCRVDRAEISPSVEKPRLAASSVSEGMEIYMPLEGLIDVEVEQRRLNKELEKARDDLQATLKKLTNRDFVMKAKPEVVERERQKLKTLETVTNKLERHLGALGASEG